MFNFMKKGIPSSLNIFTKKNERYYFYLLIPYTRASLSTEHQTVTIMNCYCYTLFSRRVFLLTALEKLNTRNFHNKSIYKPKQKRLCLKKKQWSFWTIWNKFLQQGCFMEEWKLATLLTKYCHNTKNWSCAINYS